MRNSLLIAGLVLVLGLSGCGYHLRGSAESGAVPRQLFVDAPLWVRDEMRILVESAGGEVLKGPDGADSTIRFREDAFDKRVISVDSRTGKEREVELSYSLYFDASDAAGQPLLTNQRVHLLRDFTIDADAVLGKGAEESVLKEEMRRDAISQLLRRVESALDR